MTNPQPRTAHEQLEEQRKSMLDWRRGNPTLADLRCACAALQPADPDVASLADIVQALIHHVDTTRSMIPEVPSIRVDYGGR
jgi:hypothetical protein